MLYWRAAAIDAATAPLRNALSAIFADEPVGAWIASGPTDQELRTRLLRRVNWQLEDIPTEALVEEIRDQIRTIYASRNLPIHAARQAVRSLTDLAAEVASRPEPERRALSKLDLEDALEDAAGTALVALQTMAPTARPERDVLIDELPDLPFAAERARTVAGLISMASGRAILWLHGAHGVGKSVLAKLLAKTMGGRWLVLDLWPVRKDASAAMQAWRDLVRSVGDELIDGVIIDDMGSDHATALKSRLAEFGRTLGTRGGRVIITSSRPPSPALLAEADPGAIAVAAAPYFDETDLLDLIRVAPAPPEGMVKAWTVLIRVTTGGGNPLLASAKVAGLRARGWPEDALIEDFVSPSEAVQLTRDEARRKLLESLRELDEARSLDAGQLLRRVACVFGNSDEHLILRLAMTYPNLKNGGDAVAVLRGTWLESLPQGQFRVSPLIANINSDVPPEEAKRWRRIAAEHWLATRTLNERTLPLCFWNALLGEHDLVLLKLS